MKIAIFVQQLECMGGIERVVMEHLRIFSARGCELCLFVNRPIEIFKDKVSCSVYVLPADAAERGEALRRGLETERPDVLIFHGVSHEHAKQDVHEAKQLGIKTVCVIHFAFTGNIAGFGRANSWKVFRENGAECDAFATVSRIDSLFWRSLGMRSFHVQNPFVHPHEIEKKSSAVDLDLESQPINIIWVGRHTEPKQPSAALAAFALVEKECPNVHLYMLGGNKTVKQGKVEIIAEQPDLSAYWQKADIHLLTSAWESFCLVWAEAKAAGIPTAMFALPYLELAEDRRGYIAVEQGDVRGLADAVIRLVKDTELRRKMGVEAKESLAAFNDEAVWNSWQKLFAQLDDPNAGIQVDADFKMFASQIYATIKYNKQNNRWTDDFADDFQRLTRCSLRPLANATHALVYKIQKLRHG